jgi:hypothetical protein
MAATPTIRRRVPPLVAAAIVIALALGACADRPADTDPPSMDGLLLLTGDLRASTTLETCVGDPCRMETIETPDGTTWIAAGDRGVLAATLLDATLRTSGPLDPGGHQVWRAMKLVDPEGASVTGPFMFPGWDPAGTGFAVLAGGLDADPRLVLVDPSSGTAVEQTLDPPVVPAPPAWVGGDRVLLVTGTDDALTSTVIDTASGDASAGPDGARLVATSADARIVAVAGPGRAAVTVRVTSDWLAGGGPTLATIDPPDGAVAVTSLALDADGSRLAVAWLTDAGSVRVLAYARSDRWRAVDVTGAREPPAAVVAWSR